MNKETVLIIHEDEAATFYKLVINRLKSGWTDLSDDDQWSEASMLRALEEKLTAYLDDGEGDDVIVR